MESVAYILVLALGIAVLFFAIAFREPPPDHQRLNLWTKLVQ